MSITQPPHLSGATAARAFLARVESRADGEHAVAFEGDTTPRATIDDEIRCLQRGDLKGLTTTELESFFENVFRLFAGECYLPAATKLREIEMAPLRHGLRRAFERRGRSDAWARQSLLSERHGYLFLFGTTDGLALETSLPTFDAPDAAQLLGRWRARTRLKHDVAPIRWKMWVPLAEQPDIVECARRVLSGVATQSAAGSPVGPTDYSVLMFLGKLAALLMIERSADSVAALVDLATRAPETRDIARAHVFTLRSEPALAPLLAVLGN